MDFFDLLIIAFILLPVLEGIFGKKAKQRRQQKRRQSESGLPRYGTGSDQGGEAAGGRPAGEMVPDDLWELLTGQRRTPKSEEPAATREWDEEESGERGLEAWEADLEPAMDEVEYEPLDARKEEEEWVSTPPSEWLPGGRSATDERIGPEARPAERKPQEARSLERTDLPEAYSLERPVPPEPVRHAAFHRRLDSLSRPPQGQRSRVARDLSLDERKELRRAIILKEVLGPPKGLE